MTSLTKILFPIIDWDKPIQRRMVGMDNWKAAGLKAASPHANSYVVEDYRGKLHIVDQYGCAEHQKNSPNVRNTPPEPIYRWVTILNNNKAYLHESKSLADTFHAGCLRDGHKIIGFLEFFEGEGLS